ncbi:prenyltransferase [Nocardia sp. NPDC051321]|uniref:prenyltransferase n=1 Tax=Nocardia sp. NPDC051321 TaxID=3364323 RepID=UPI0037AFD92C
MNTYDLSSMDATRRLRLVAAHLGLLTRSLRPTTRVWYDILAPLAMIAVQVGRDLPWAPSCLAISAVVLFHGGQTLFNDVADIAVDQASSERSRQRRAFVRGALSRRELLVGGWLLVAAAGLLSVLLAPINQLLFLVALPLTLAYNFKPVGLSGRPLATPVFWPVTWVLMYLYCAAAIDFRGWQHGLAYLTFVAVFMGLGEGLCQDIRDVDNDAAGGRITTVVHFGVERATTWAWLAFALSLAPWLWHVYVSGMPVIGAVLGTGVLIVWLAAALRHVRRIHTRYRKEDGRFLHIGAIVTFSCMNVLVFGLAVAS